MGLGWALNEKAHVRGSVEAKWLEGRAETREEDEKDDNDDHFNSPPPYLCILLPARV